MTARLAAVYSLSRVVWSASGAGRSCHRRLRACSAGAEWRQPRTGWGRSVVTIGVFDGMRRDHAHLLGQAKRPTAWAKYSGVDADVA